jgi:hypothetical protein
MPKAHMELSSSNVLRIYWKTLYAYLLRQIGMHMNLGD